MAHDDTGLHEKVTELQAENERLRHELACAQADRDQYRRELFLAFPPPDYTDSEIADLINNRIPAEKALREIREKHGDRDR
jgi:hypothetical protein